MRISDWSSDVCSSNLMQFDMYHHYTVDEHTIRAIGLLNRIEKGELKEDHPRSTRLIHRVGSRRAQYVAVLLHDIAKGRGGDHSRSEEHTSELQSLMRISYAVFCLKKKKKQQQTYITKTYKHINDNQTIEPC